MGVLQWEDQQDHPLPQDFSDMLGWEEMAQKMAKAYATLKPEERKKTILFCDNYGIAGALNYYGKKYELPEAYSDNASFLYWMPNQLQPTNIILLTDDKEEMTHPFIKEFDSAALVDSITAPYARERGDLIIVLKGASVKFEAYFKDKISKKKAAWQAP